VALTFGNAPESDLLVQSPQGVKFTVDVKGQSTKNFWLIQTRQKNPDHYFILVYLPHDLISNPTFFILSSDELMRRREEYKERVIHRGKYRDELGGINWSTASDYEGKWNNLPQYRCPEKFLPQHKD
jgi:hypothetical protein